MSPGPGFCFVWLVWILDYDRKPLRSLRLLAGAFAGGLRFLHPFRHFCLHSVEIEARAALHRRVIEEGVEFLAHYLLGEHEPPKLEPEAVEVLLLHSLFLILPL
jgi:hypothetical protein